MLAVVVVLSVSLLVGIRAVTETSTHRAPAIVSQLLDCGAGRAC